MWARSYISDRVDVRLKDLASKRDGIQSEIMALQREP